MSGGAGSGSPCRPGGPGVIVRVRLTPKSAADAVEGVTGAGGEPVLKARVRAAPEKGKANAALEALLARWLGVPRGSVHVARGSKGRVKRLHITGDAAALQAAFAARLDGKR